MRIIALFLVLAGWCAGVDAPFPIMAGKKLAAYAKANDYTAEQIRNATPEQVFTHLSIDPESEAARKYRAFERVIKGHAINFLGLQTPPTTVESVKQKLFELFENLRVIYSQPKRLVLLDLDGQYPDMETAAHPTDPNIIIIYLEGK